jgi:mono/diheme cytochrome c family protein
MVAVAVAAALALGAALAAAPARADEAALELRAEGKPVKRLARAELDRLVAPARLVVLEPHEGVDRTYEGYPFAALLDAVYGPAWRKGDVVVLGCADGYAPAVPVAKLIAHQSLLAFRRADGAPFAMKNRSQGDERVELAPYYLVWENRRDAVARADGGAHWPYQVTSVDLVAFPARYPGLAPPPRAAEGARRGLAAFVKHCMPCHTVNGEGGDKAPELNYPVSVVEYIAEPFLRRWIEAPAQVRWNTRMPGLNPDEPDRARVVDDLVAYLRAMATAKRAPRPRSE